MRRKIALIVPMLQPYRLTFYEKLSKFNPDAEWMVYHGIKLSEDGRPAFKGKVPFHNTGCVERKYRIGPYTILTHKGLLNEVKNFNPDMIIIQAITGNFSYRRVVNWANRNNKIVINWTCAWDPGLAKGVLLELKNYFVGRFFKKGQAFLTYSTKALNYVSERGIDPSLVSVCYNGLEIDDVIREESELKQKSLLIRKDLGLDDYTTFLYVGGLIAEKRVDMLIEAFTKLKTDYPMIKLLIIGDGPLKEEISAMINKLNDPDIVYLGRIIDGVEPYFAASTCLVLPGVGGLAMNQAMFWQKICIVSEADGTEDDLVVDNHTGFRFEKDNAASLAEAMKKVILLPGEHKSRMGERARNIILTKSNVNHMVDVFTETILKFFPGLNHV